MVCAYIGLTRCIQSRFRGIASRPDIPSHVSRGFTSIFPLALGWGQFAGRLEKAMIARIKHSQALTESMPIVANKGDGGEGARKGIKTLLYLVVRRA